MFMVVYHSGHEHCYAVGPRQRVQLLPEPTDDDRHVEAEDERDRDEIVVFLAVGRQVLEPSTTSMHTDALGQTSN